ncbi:MAG: ribosome maturation factor RimP [Bacillota bacterium]
MKEAKLEEKVESLVTPVISDNGYELVDIEYKKEGRNWYLRFFIDHPEGVTLDGCGLISKQVEAILDEANAIPQTYILEVSSPGLERPLKKDSDYHRFAGRKVLIHTFAPLLDKKEITGVLQGLEDGQVVIFRDGELLKIPYQQVALARLVVDF